MIGIVKKTGLIQINFARHVWNSEGQTQYEAAYQGCQIHFRPIMMTTMCALLGVLPIALGQGAGEEAHCPLGLCVVGRLLFSQLITLYLTKVQSRISRPKITPGHP